MYLDYGGYQHAPGECEMDIGYETEFSPDGVPFVEHHRWNMRGRLQRDDADSLQTAMAQLEAAYVRQNQSIVLFRDDGTVHQALYNADTLGGVRSLGVRWPTGRGDEGGTYRTFSISIEAEKLITTPGVLAWQDNLRYWGGGPRLWFVEVQEGVGQKQQSTTNTPYECEQQGFAIGYSTWPPIAQPAFPGDLEENPQIDLGSPVRFGQSGKFGYTQYRRSWRYKFKRWTPFETVSPSLPP